MAEFTAAAPRVSVILPCHNPRKDYLARTLAALRQQTLPAVDWELVVVDNASAPPLAEWVDVAWHPRGRLVREEQLGLTPARRRGIAATQGALLVFVDDDNVLAADYLECAAELARAKPFLGAFGGSIAPEFETPPPKWTRPYWACVAIRPATRSVWSNDIDHWESTPIGAGLCVRRDVADRYVRDLATDPLRCALDRTGESLISGGDMDLVWTGLQLGFGMGRFAELRLTHLIPPARLTAAYLCRMHEGNGYTHVILNRVWSRHDPQAQTEGLWRLLRLGWRSLAAHWKSRRFLAAKRRGADRARAQLARMES